MPRPPWTERYVEGARTVFEGAVARRWTTYANLCLPMPAGDGRRTDVPVLRGVDRARFRLAPHDSLGKPALVTTLTRAHHRTPTVDPWNG